MSSVGRMASQLDDSLYRQIFDGVHIGMYLVDFSLRFVRVNAALCKMLAYEPEELLGQSLLRIVHPDHHRETADLAARVESGEIDDFKRERFYVRRDGSAFRADLRCTTLRGEDGRVRHALGIIEDVTEQHATREEHVRQRQELTRAEKMISLGTLVGGIAHEINNPNQFLLLNLEFLRAVWSDAQPLLEARAAENPQLRLGNLPIQELREEVPELFDELIRGVERVKHIVAELRDYSSEGAPGPMEPIDINAVLRSALTLLSNPVKKATRHFSADLGDGLPPVEGNLRRLEQVVINLVLNACQALENSGQAILLGTTLGADGDTVVLTVEDHGHGIAAEDRARILDPFFTTRRDGGHSGLGLAVASRIVEEHAGRLEFDSTPGHGTTVRLVLPVYAEEEGS